MVPLGEILMPQTHSGQCPSSPQPHRGLQDRQCQFDQMAEVGSVFTVRFGCLLKRATGNDILCSSDTTPTGFCREFLRAMTDRYGEMFLHEDGETLYLFTASTRNASDARCYFKRPEYASSTSRPPGSYSCNEFFLHRCDIFIFMRIYA